MKCSAAPPGLATSIVTTGGLHPRLISTKPPALWERVLHLAIVPKTLPVKRLPPGMARAARCFRGANWSPPRAAMAIERETLPFQPPRLPNARAGLPSARDIFPSPGSLFPRRDLHCPARGQVFHPKPPRFPEKPPVFQSQPLILLPVTAFLALLPSRDAPDTAWRGRRECRPRPACHAWRPRRCWCSRRGRHT